MSTTAPAATPAPTTTEAAPAAPGVEVAPAAAPAPAVVEAAPAATPAVAEAPPVVEAAPSAEELSEMAVIKQQLAELRAAKERTEAALLNNHWQHAVGQHRIAEEVQDIARERYDRHVASLPPDQEAPHPAAWLAEQPWLARFQIAEPVAETPSQMRGDAPAPAPAATAPARPPVVAKPAPAAAPRAPAAPAPAPRPAARPAPAPAPAAVAPAQRAFPSWAHTTPGGRAPNASGAPNAPGSVTTPVGGLKAMIDHLGNPNR